MRGSLAHRQAVVICCLWLLVWASTASTASTALAAADGQNQGHTENRSNHQKSAVVVDAKARLPVALPEAAQQVSAHKNSSATYPLIVHPVAQLGGIKGNIAAIRTVEGRLSRHTFLVNGPAKPSQFGRTLHNALSKAGFKMLYQCLDKACGPEFTSVSPGYRTAPKLFSAAAGYYLAATRNGTANKPGDVYVALQAVAHGNGVALEYDVVHVKPRVVRAISVNAAEMARQIRTSGRAALYGIFFNTNSARIKPGFDAVLQQIARLLKNQPKLRLLVVGHTDSTGTFAYNMRLSRQRAKAVVAALVNREHVDPDRLKAVGDGYTAPAASNATSLGRAKNRRVELVPW